MLKGNQRDARGPESLLEMVILKFPTLCLLVAAVLLPLGCAKNLDGNTSFKEASKGFEKELPAENESKLSRHSKPKRMLPEHAGMTAR